LSFSIERIAEATTFEGLKPVWDDLHGSMEFPEIFYGWDWTFLSWRHFRKDDELFVLLIRDTSRQEIVGIAPFCIHSTRRLGVSVRVVEAICAGLSDYCNIMIRQGVHRGRVVQAVLEFMRAERGQWDVIDLPELRARDSTTLHILDRAPFYPDWSVRTHVSTGIAMRDLTRSSVVEDHKQTRRIRNKLKSLQERGLRLRLGCDDIETYWAAFRDLHRKAWPAGAFANARQEAFFNELKSSPGLKGRIELSVAELDGRPVAMHFGFVDDRKVYFYMPAMDQAFRKERVGSVLLHAMIEHYGKTHQIFDFLRGLEAYKLWYTDQVELNLRLVIYRSASLPALLYNFNGVTRRYGVELGLPKAAMQLAKRWMSKIRPHA
jgi:CelD/BcsL family acetyltransferase involved in cellulose biosynthesis